MARRILAVLLVWVLTLGAAAGAFVNPASWAVDELNAAAEAGLIPDIIADADLSASITRAEFAALSVRLYEALTGTAADAEGAAFSDTDDPSVRKAVALGFTNGTGGGRFSPDDAVSRQDAATMLSRVYKKVYFEYWTLEGDGQFRLPLVRDGMGVVFFEDHDRIDDWARDAVYFLNLHGVIRGDNHGKFNPHNRDGAFSDTTGTAARQEAILMALRAFSAFPMI